MLASKSSNDEKSVQLRDTKELPQRHPLFLLGRTFICSLDEACLDRRGESLLFLQIESSGWINESSFINPIGKPILTLCRVTIAVVQIKFMSDLEKSIKAVRYHFLEKYHFSDKYGQNMNYKRNRGIASPTMSLLPPCAPLSSAVSVVPTSAISYTFRDYNINRT
ncbi:hypothetical protein V1477_010061 [Vespula maculifrons]|uniref:Uncharacterized protein n=1 Tax=Vespula maculifrons TaxID=7453 RepID=A0ABD2CBK4_VESMC